MDIFVNCIKFRYLTHRFGSNPDGLILRLLPSGQVLFSYCKLDFEASQDFYFVRYLSLSLEFEEGNDISILYKCITENENLVMLISLVVFFDNSVNMWIVL